MKKILIASLLIFSSLTTICMQQLPSPFKLFEEYDHALAHGHFPTIRQVVQKMNGQHATPVSNDEIQREIEQRRRDNPYLPSNMPETPLRTQTRVQAQNLFAARTQTPSPCPSPDQSQIRPSSESPFYDILNSSKEVKPGVRSRDGSIFLCSRQLVF